MPPQESEWIKRLDDLARRAIEGSEEAARELYGEYGCTLHILIRQHLNRRVRVVADEEDVAQDVWKSFFRRLAAGEINNPQTLVACLRQLAIHKAQKANRHHLDTAKRDVRRQSSFDDLGPEERGSLIDSAPTPAETAESLDWARAAWGRLPRQLQRILTYRTAGWPYSRIADLLGVSERTVRRMVEEARDGVLASPEGG
jgi:RNA polymerase sigma factor (sigma-70 family)